jgi:hypothetical protein
MTRSNCFVCISRSVFDPLFVLNPIKGFCPHSKCSTALTPTFKISKMALIFNLLLALSLLYPTVTSLPSIMRMCRIQKSLCLIILGDQLFIVSSSILEILITAKVKALREEMLTWSNIFQHRQFYGLGDIIDTRKSKRIVMANSIFILLIFIGIIMEGIYFFSSETYDTLPWHHARKISLCLAGIFQSYIVLDAYQKLITVGAILNAMETALHETRFTRDLNVFKKQVHLIALINCTARSVMNLMTTFLVLWMLTLTSFLICNCYSLVDNASYDFLTIVMTQIKTISIIANCTVYLFMHDETRKRKVSLSLLQLSKILLLLFILLLHISNRSILFIEQKGTLS